MRRSHDTLLTMAATALLTLGAAPLASAQTYLETPMYVDAVGIGNLPPVEERVPDVPAVVDLEALGRELGVSGGEISWVAGRARDIRIMNVYGYARLVGYNEAFELVADIVESFEVEEGRIFTFNLRPGMRWSDGHPFTAEDFRYKWEDVLQNAELTPYGVDPRLLVNGEPPTMEVLDATTVRYTWAAPNPEFLPALAGARPLYIYTPAHYLQQFHIDHADPAELQAAIEEAGERNWSALHIRRGDLYDADNPNLPVLQPWVNRTPPPGERFVFERNPYYHRVDTQGYQLPYLDRVIVNIASSGLIAAKAGAGESDLQARHIRFADYTYLKEGEERNDYTVRLWPTALGSDLAIYPNLNANDPVWRELMRNVSFRRALAVAIDRDLINEVIYFGLAMPGANSALPQSPMYDAERSTNWHFYDPDLANQLLDEIGLTERRGDGIRIMPNGEPLEIIVETAGERPEEIDILELVADNWRDVGVGLFTRNSQRDVFRTRVFNGDTLMSVWFGFDNALFTSDTVPHELAPVDQNWLYAPKWGQYAQTGGDTGVAPDMDFAIELMDLYREWMAATDRNRREEIVGRMLDINVDYVTSIGTVQGVLQPVVVNNALHNVPGEAIYSWDPGSHFGIYRPDTFWLETATQ